MFKQFVAAAAAVALAGGAMAQETKKDLVARVLKLQQPGIEALAQQIAQQPALQVMQQASVVVQRLPADKREATAKDIEADLRKYAEEATPLVRERAVRVAPQTIGPLLEDRFTEDELRQIIAILESPVNRKFQSLAPEMQKVLTDRLVADTRGAVEPKVREMQANVSKRLGLPPPGSAPAASGPRK